MGSGGWLETEQGELLAGGWTCFKRGIISSNSSRLWGQGIETRWYWGVLCPQGHTHLDPP